jgi:hypothetical protein
LEIQIVLAEEMSIANVVSTPHRFRMRSENQNNHAPFLYHYHT